MNKKGLAQIPLMIVLLLMAVAIPVATRLVQQNQENRGQAACYANYAGCSNNASCCSGICQGICKPAPTSTPRPPTCVGSGGSCATSGCCAGLNCVFGTCRSEIGPINPSVTPIPRICNPGATKCRDTNSVDVCNTNGTGWSILRTCAYGCLNGDCKAAPPTAVPPTTAPACNATPGQYCANSPTSCTNAGNSIGSGSCAGVGYVCCKSAPAPPSATPTPICNGQACVLYCATNGMKPTCGNNGICVCVALPTAIATPTKIPGGPIIPIATNTPPVGNKCPGAEACPNSSNKNLLQSCTPADSDGTPKESSCTIVGRIEPCGGKNYCCPSAGGAWTTDMTKCPTTCKVKTGDYTLNDFSIWRSEYIEGSFGGVSRNTWNADFDCDGKVTLNDFSVWRPNYFNDLLKN